MSDRVARFAKLQADRAWKRWADRQLKQRTAQQQKLESAGIYIGYQADSEQHEIRLLSGKKVLAESITNAGLDAGDPVVVSRGGGGFRFKAMPR